MVVGHFTVLQIPHCLTHHSVHLSKSSALDRMGRRIKHNPRTTEKENGKIRQIKIEYIANQDKLGEKLANQDRVKLKGKLANQHRAK